MILGYSSAIDSIPNYWVGTQFLDNTISGDGSIPRLIIVDGDTPPADTSAEMANTSDNSPDMELEGTRGFVEVKRVEKSQTALFPPGPWWQR